MTVINFYFVQKKKKKKRKEDLAFNSYEFV